jgi:light-regulated signal transduction histidine kinase (bacteriophytochrome)
LALAIEASSAVVTVDWLPVIQSNEIRLVWLFQNLISNVVKYRSERPLPGQWVNANRWGVSIRARESHVDFAGAVEGFKSARICKMHRVSVRVGDKFC